MVGLVIKHISTKAFDVNQPMPGNLQTPLHFAIIEKKLEVVQALIQLGADLMVKDAQDKTPEDYLCQANRNESDTRKMMRLIRRRRRTNNNSESIQTNQTSETEDGKSPKTKKTFFQSQVQSNN